jgi:hypothetical protein
VSHDRVGLGHAPKKIELDLRIWVRSDIRNDRLKQASRRVDLTGLDHDGRYRLKRGAVPQIGQSQRIDPMAAPDEYGQYIQRQSGHIPAQTIPLRRQARDLDQVVGTVALKGQQPILQGFVTAGYLEIVS